MNQSLRYESGTAPPMPRFLAWEQFLEAAEPSVTRPPLEAYEHGVTTLTASTEAATWRLEPTWIALRELVSSQPEASERWTAWWNLVRIVPRNRIASLVIEVAELSATDPKSVFASLLTARRKVGYADESPPRIRERNQAAIALLRSWRSERADAQEQHETLEFLKKALDQDRVSDRKLFP